MAYLVRKVSRAKWPDDMCNPSEIPGDAISELRTTKNTLSLWRIEDESDLKSAALALAASSSTSKIEQVSVVWIPEELFAKNGIQLDDSSPGDTVVFDLANTHRDLCNVTYSTLGDVAQIIMNAIVKEGHYRRFKKSEIKEALVKAYTEERIKEEKCQKELIEEIKKKSKTGI